MPGVNVNVGDDYKASVSPHGGPGGRAMAAIVSRLSDGRKKHLLSRLSRLLFLGSQQHFPQAHTGLSGFLSPNTSAFYTYRGSLTMPPCSEVVTWTVFDRLLDVGEEQVRDSLCNVEDAFGDGHVGVAFGSHV
ncbi:unnamed protein product, partial [Ixodes persulcatus]